MKFDWPQECSKIKNRKNITEASGTKRDQPSRGQGGGRGEGKPPPRLEALGGSDRKAERFGGSEERDGGKKNSEY